MLFNYANTLPFPDAVLIRILCKMRYTVLRAGRSCSYRSSSSLMFAICALFFSSWISFANCSLFFCMNLHFPSLIYLLFFAHRGSIIASGLWMIWGSVSGHRPSAGMILQDSLSLPAWSNNNTGNEGRKDIQNAQFVRFPLWNF